MRLGRWGALVLADVLHDLRPHVVSLRALGDCKRRSSRRHGLACLRGQARPDAWKLRPGIGPGPAACRLAPRHPKVPLRNPCEGKLGKRPLRLHVSRLAWIPRPCAALFRGCRKAGPPHHAKLGSTASEAFPGGVPCHDAPGGCVGQAGWDSHVADA